MAEDHPIGNPRKAIKALVAKFLKSKEITYTRDLDQKGRIPTEAAEAVKIRIVITNPQTPEALELIEQLGLVPANTNNQQILKLTCTHEKTDDDGSGDMFGDEEEREE